MRVSKIPNPYCTNDTVPYIEEWQINDFSDGCRNEISKALIERYKDKPLTIMDSGNDKKEFLSADWLCPLITTANKSTSSVGVYDAEYIYEFFYNEDSIFRAHYAGDETAYKRIERYGASMPIHGETIFQIHQIQDTEMKEVVNQTIIHSDCYHFIRREFEEINFRHILILTSKPISLQKDISGSYSVLFHIASFYEPLSMTVITLLPS